MLDLAESLLATMEAKVSAFPLTHQTKRHRLSPPFPFLPSAFHARELVDSVHEVSC